MAVYIGVSRKREFLHLEPGSQNFWCLQRARDAKQGDLILLYFPVSIGPTNAGIRQVYRVTRIRQGTGESECKTRNMATVDTELLLNLDERITIKDMKEDEIVQRMGAVGRNMQGVTFSVDSEIWPSLRDLIVSRNPEAEAVLDVD